MAPGEMSRTPPGLMSGLAWSAGPSYNVSKVLGRGSGSHPHLIPPESLRVLRDESWGHYRLLNCRQVRRMGTGNPSSVWALHLLSVESYPWPIVRTTPGTDHVCSQRVYRGRAGLTSRSGSALRSHSG